MKKRIDIILILVYLWVLKRVAESFFFASKFIVINIGIKCKSAFLLEIKHGHKR